MFDNINSKSLVGCEMSTGSIDELRSLRRVLSYMHCCRALTFASARLSCCYGCVFYATAAEATMTSAVTNEPTISAGEQSKSIVSQFTTCTVGLGLELCSGSAPFTL